MDMSKMEDSVPFSVMGYQGPTLQPCQGERYSMFATRGGRAFTHVAQLVLDHTRNVAPFLPVHHLPNLPHQLGVMW